MVKLFEPLIRTKAIQAKAAHKIGAIQADLVHEIEELIQERDEYIDKECMGCWIVYVEKQEQVRLDMETKRLDEEFEAGLELEPPNDELDHIKYERDGRY